MADITQDFVDANVLTAAQLNGWKDDRTGSLLPVAPSAGASPYNYTGATYDLGSATYTWKDIYAQGDLNLYESGTKKIFLSPDASTTSYFNTSNGIYVFGATSAAFSSKVEITGNTYITGSLNVGSTGGYDNKVTIFDSGTDGTIIRPLKIYAGKTGGGATSSGFGVGMEFQWIQQNGNPYVGARVDGVASSLGSNNGDLSVKTNLAGSFLENMIFSAGGTVTSNYLFEAKRTLAANNAIEIAADVYGNYGGATAAGFGVGLGFTIIAPNTNPYQIARIVGISEGSSGRGNLEFYVMNSSPTYRRGGYFDYNGDFYLGYNATISGVLSVPNQEVCSVKGTDATTQSISTGTVTAINYGVEVTDVGSMHSTSSNTSRITVNTSGLYVITATVYLDAATGWDVYIRKNGSTYIAATSGVQAYGNISAATALSAGDYVEVCLFQASGVSLDTTFKDRTIFSVIKTA